MQDCIKNFVRNYHIVNKTVTDWEEPLVASANADDPLFLRLKMVVSETHRLPTELLKDAKTVISYFIPFERKIVLSNVGGKYSSKEWAMAYVETNELISDLNESLSTRLKKLGFESFILPPTHNFDEEKLMSDWSHKHVAFIAGLGKFGLHRMLITEKGCCGRLGSLITDVVMEPTRKPEKEFCLYKNDGSCNKCVDNCIFEALRVDSFDRYKCHKICLYNAKLYSELGLADVCGKCVCGVPCSFADPAM